VLEPYKNVDGLVEAWRLAAPHVRGARLQIVGRGSLSRLVERLVAELPEQTGWTPALAAEEVAAALDESTVLVLPSRSEGMGRVVIEAFCRRRPVIGSQVGGIPQLVEHGRNGLLVAPNDSRALADAIVRVLSDRELAARLAGGIERVASVSPSDYAASMRSSIERARQVLRSP
jgi:glycosyltransferase involved in cell wall biosynthesis